MKVTTEGLTLGVIASLEAKGYKVELEDDGLYANITKDVPVPLENLAGQGGMVG